MTGIVCPHMRPRVSLGGWFVQVPAGILRLAACYQPLGGSLAGKLSAPVMSTMSS